MERSRAVLEPRDEGPEPGLRRLEVSVRSYAASFGLSRHDVDDITQETFARVLRAKGHLDPETTAGYCLVVVRNLVRDQHRHEMRHRRHVHLLGDERAPALPESAVESADERRALSAALDELPVDQRRLLLAHDVEGVPLTEAGAVLGRSGSAGALAAQLARTRARMRVDYLVNRRRSPMPTRRCRPVLLAVSAADTGAQHRLRAGAHLLRCPACAQLAPALVARQPAAVLWVAVPAALAGAATGAWRRLTEMPSHVTAAVAGTVAAAGVVAYLTLGTGSPQVRQPASDLTGPRGAVLAHLHDLGPDAGRLVRATGVPVLSVPSDEGFWVGHGARRIWVELRGRGESERHVKAGEHLWFRGTLVRHGAGFADRVGVTRREGEADLTGMRFHIEVEATGVRRTPPGPADH